MFTSPLILHATGYIGGAFLSEGGSARLSVIDPATGEQLVELPSYGAAETLRAIDAARAPLAAPAPLEQRAAWLEAIAAALTTHRDELARIVTLENGKPLAEARGEVDYAAGFYRDAARHVEVLRPRVLSPGPRGLTWTIYARPAGIAGLITPWNFPIAMLAKKLSAAIAAGAPAVVKPAEKTPLTCIAFFQLLDQIGMPPGMVNLVFGDAPAIGRVLCEHPQVRVISFTGSTAVGKLLAAQAAPHIKRMSLELGGNAPFIVFDDADLDVAADQLMASKFRAAGQTCVSANRVYVHARVASDFSARVATRVRALRAGHGLDAGVTLGPLIDRAALAKVQRAVDEAVAAGATTIVGERIDRDGASFYPATIVSGARAGMRLLTEETFGPVIPLVHFDGEDEVVHAANDTEHGLAAYLFTGDLVRAERVIARLHFGHVGLNTGAGPTPEAPFGGMKHSGLGREGGAEGVLEYVELQTVPRG